MGFLKIFILFYNSTLLCKIIKKLEMQEISGINWNPKTKAACL